MELYFIIQFAILLCLMIRIVYYLNFNKEIITNHLELLSYITLLFIDTFINFTFGKNIFPNNIFDSILPLIIIVPIAGRKYNFHKDSVFYQLEFRARTQ
jgi:hypothetical protein